MRFHIVGTIEDDNQAKEISEIARISVLSRHIRGLAYETKFK